MEIRVTSDQEEVSIKASQEHITKQDTMVSELQLERNEPKAAYAKLKQEVERAYNECFIDGRARLVASSTPSINMDSIEASFRDLLEEKTAWERKVECQWVYDWDAGNKHLARIDTGEIIKRELIQNHERQKSLMEEVSERAAEELKGVDGVKNTSFTMENGTPTVNIEMED